MPKMRVYWFAAMMLGLAIMPQEARSVAQPVDRSKTDSTYLVVFRPGPSWREGRPIGEQPLGAHGQYMLSLYTKGILKMAGPFSDNGGGAVVFNANSEEAARAVVAADPAVISGVFVADLHPWALVDWEQRAKNQKK
jgi:uncharacterized protein YciI